MGNGLNNSGCCVDSNYFAYYILATLLPVDKIIGRIYPLFGALLLFMSVGMVYGLVVSHFSATDPIEFSVQSMLMARV